MRKAYLLITAMLFAFLVNAQDWNISDPAFNALGVMTETQTVEGLTIYAAEGKAVEVDGNNKSLDGVSYTHRLKFGGAGGFTDGAPTDRVLGFDVTGDVTITIMSMSASGTADRELTIAAGSNTNVIGTAPALGASLTASKITYVGDATSIYIWSPSSGVNVYRILVEEGVEAGPAKLGYFTKQKGMDAWATTVEDDPILKMFMEDENFEVTANIIEDAGADATYDLSGYDVVFVQESFGSGDGILKPGSALGLASIDVPFFYNKTYALRDGRGFTGGAAGSGSEVSGLNITVPAENQGHDLFKGLLFVDDQLRLFKKSTNDSGAEGSKALNYAVDVEISGDNTLIAQPSEVGEGHDLRVFLNDIAAGTTVGSETLAARMMTIGYNFGSISANGGTNLTDAGLTIVRNAIYILAGLEVPETAAAAPEFEPAKLGYFAKQKDMAEGASTVANDPILRLFMEDELFEVTANIVEDASAETTYDLSGYDVVFVQESFGSGDGILKPGSSLGLASIDVPFFYNKTYALRDGRGFTDGAAGSGAETAGLNITVPADNQGHDLFKGLTFEDDQLQLFKKSTNDSGAEGAKALNYAKDVVISAENTLIAQPTNVVDGDNLTVFINDIAAGSTVGSEMLAARMMTIGYNFGSISADKGTNLTEAGITIVRNAIYILAGYPVPATPAVVPEPEPVKLGYFAKQKDMVEGASTVADDPILKLFMEDENFEVTANIVDDAGADATYDLSDYDVVFVQESFGSGDGILKPGSSLGLASINVPFFYNKTYALRDGRGFTDGAAGSGAETAGLNITVPADNQGHDLFKGLSFEDDQLQLFKRSTNDSGADGVKALNYAKDVVISAENTLIAQPTNVVDGDNLTIFINDIAAGSTIGSEMLAARMMTIGYNFGSISADNGTNLTDAGLTIVRNAIYILAGLAVPETAAVAPIGETSIPKQTIQLNVYSANGNIVINDCAGKDVSVFAVTGTKVFGATASSSVVTVPVPTGIYIVVVDNVATKVIVR